MECYCGCGQRIGALATARRSANKMGRTITEMLASIERDVRPAPGVSPDDPNVKAFQETARKKVQEGEWFEQDCRKVVHEEMPFGDAPWPAMREWVRDAQGMTAFFRLPPDAQRRIMSSG